MKIKKKQIEEILDKDGNIIGNNSVPKVDINMDSDAHGTTDQNAGMHAQNFKNDFLGRFGFYYYEDSEQETPEVVNDIAKVAYKKFGKILNHYKNDYKKLRADLEKFNSDEDKPQKSDMEFAYEIMSVIKPHMEKAFDSENKKLDESEIVEDKIADKKTDKSVSEKKEDNDLKLKQVADLLNKLPKNELDKLMNLLEYKKK
jgi:hypothetical protein